MTKQELNQKVAEVTRDLNFLRNSPTVSPEQLNEVLTLLLQAKQKLVDTLNKVG